MFSSLISAPVTVLFTVLAAVSALPIPQQQAIQDNFLVPTQIRTAEPQITGVLNQNPQPSTNSLFSSVIIDILPQISNFTKRLESRNGVQTSPEDFVSAVTDLTYSFIGARARDEGREVTQKEVDSVILTEAAFNITLELVKSLSQGNNIAFAIRRFTEITPRLAEIGAAVEGRTITKDEIDDLKEANELVRVLTPFFVELSKLNLNAGQFTSVTGNLSNYNVDVIQDYANQNLRNIRDFTKSNFQNFKDYSQLQFPEFSSDRAQEYFENNVHRVKDLTRLGLKNAETLPERLATNGGNFGKISSQVADIINFSGANIKSTQQINLQPLLDDTEFARRTLDVTSFSESLTNRIQRMINLQTVNSNKKAQTARGTPVTPLFNHQVPTLTKHLVGALQSNTQTARGTPVTPLFNQQVPTLTKPLVGALQSNIQTPLFNQQVPTITKPLVGVLQSNTQSHTKSKSPQQITSSRSTSQLKSQTPISKGKSQTPKPKEKSQTIQTESHLTQNPLSPATFAGQTVVDQDLAAQLANGNARVVAFVRTPVGLVPLVTYAQGATL